MDVTPSYVAARLDQTLCGNYGAGSVVVDPARPAEIYAQADCLGIWKSTDYGWSWTGPIEVGANGADAAGCSGELSIGRGPAGGPPIPYKACYHGPPHTFWVSTNGGADWAYYDVIPIEALQTYPAINAPAVDPYDSQHLLVSDGTINFLVESTNGGQQWTSVPLGQGVEAGALGGGGVFFIDHGPTQIPRTTWLWVGVNDGTWLGADGGWTEVDLNVGSSQIFQPDTSGVVFMGGNRSVHGDGVLRSADYGATWVHVGASSQEAVVVGTSKNVYAMYGYAYGAGTAVPPSLEYAPLPGTDGWGEGQTPMTQGPRSVAVTNDGTHGIIVAACKNVGLWRYVEP